MFSFIVILAGLLWGLLSIFVNGTIDAGFSTFQCVALRLFFTFLILFIIILIKNKRFPKIDIKDCIFFLGMGLGCLGSSVFYFLAIKEIGNAGIPAMLLDTSPIFVVFFSAVLFRDKITIKKIIALILCCVGVVFTTGVIGGADQVPITGILIGVLAGVSYAIYSIINKILVKKYDSLVITAYAFLFATVFIVPFCGIFNKLYLLNNVKTDLYVLALALVGTVIPFVLYSIGLKHMNASIVSILATSELIMASIVGALFYDEKFTVIKIIGSLSILAAIIILNINFKKKKTKNA